MDIEELNYELERYDDQLYAEYLMNGKVLVKRKRPRTRNRRNDYVLGEYVKDQRSVKFIKWDIARRDLWKGNCKDPVKAIEDQEKREEKQSYDNDLAIAKEAIGIGFGHKVFT